MAPERPEGVAQAAPVAVTETPSDERSAARGTAAEGDVDRGAERERPRPADGIEFIGEYEGSGFKEAPSLVRRTDGQVIQLPPLLYEVAVRADGERTYDDIAGEVSAAIQRGVDASAVEYLVAEKLRPLGILAAADGSSPALKKPDPFLGLKLRFAVIPESVSVALGSAFKGLFLPFVVIVVLGAFIVVDWWVFGVHGVAQSVRESIYNPVVFLALFGAIVVSAAFHEIGHAAGCRYGGGRPGKMGCGLYLAWPAFYTDVTDAYRLGRRGRLRTDLGGVYFNIIIVVLTMGAYLLTRFEPLLLLIVVQHFEIAHQLLPIVRLDGYYIVADATGVPDLFARIGPILRSLVPGRKPDERVRVLKRWVRVAVTTWVLVVVPLLAFELFVLVLHLPRILGTAWDSATLTYAAASDAFGDGNWLGGLGSAVQLLVLAIPIVGIVLVLLKSMTGGGRWIWRRTEDRPVVRAVTVAAAVAGVSMLAWSWLSPDNYEPIRPGERGTLVDSVRAVSYVSELPRVEQPRVNAATTTTTTTATTVPATTTTVASTETSVPAGAPASTTTVAPTTTVAVSTTVPATTTTQASSTTTAVP